MKKLLICIFFFYLLSYEVGYYKDMTIYGSNKQYEFGTIPVLCENIVEAKNVEEAINIIKEYIEIKRIKDGYSKCSVVIYECKRIAKPVREIKIEGAK